MNIIIFGPPGSGKGTQSCVLSKKYGLNIITAGDLLRAEVVANNIDIKVKNAIESGTLVEDKFICDIIYKQLKLSASNFILDGFPRNLNQAKFLNKVLKAVNQVINYIVELQISDNVIIERIANRFMCFNCGNIYNLMYINEINKCKKCGSKEIRQRYDDRDLSIVRKRIMEYKVQMEDLRKYYRGKILEVNGEMNIAQVSEVMYAFFS
ncbi:adenylate kinase family protein [Candidatus Mesenet endosymbiont of Agriotes lineatus]|uniref:adenylate kinase family protein n=1 Tax=Candidatus Mesenet endosymbiont of Agriotes lineatus TaxID=3077948 RepID=UPI0030D0EC57